MGRGGRCGILLPLRREGKPEHSRGSDSTRPADYAREPRWSREPDPASDVLLHLRVQMMAEDPSLPFQPVQRRIQWPMVDLQHVLR
jgi:hypothetical protein